VAVHLSDQDIKTVVGIIDGWPSGKILTWQSLLEESFLILRRRYTRQAFARYERIKLSYQVRKRNPRHGKEKSRGKSIELQKALERIERLEAENKRLETENHGLLEQFVRWAYNAHNKNITEETLNRLLPTIDRKRTKR
jgi:hypothetical protein